MREMNAHVTYSPDCEHMIVAASNGEVTGHFQSEYGNRRKSAEAQTELRRDHGYFARFPNPLNENAAVVLINGIHTAGVVGGARGQGGSPGGLVAGHRPRAVPDGGLRPCADRRAPRCHRGRVGRAAGQQDGTTAPRAHAGRPRKSHTSSTTRRSTAVWGRQRSWPVRWTTLPRWPRCRTSRCRCFRPSRILPRQAS